MTNGVFYLAACCVALVLGPGCSKESRKARYIKSGDKYFSAQQYDKAEVEYLNAFRLDPQSVVLVQRLGAIYFEQGRLERAFGFLQRARELSADDAETRFMLALLHFSGGNTPKAREELAAALAKDPLHAEAIGLVAETALTPAERQQVREQIQSWRGKSGDKAPFHLALGVLAIRENNPQAAETELKQALAMDPGLAPAHASLGILYWQTNDLPGAGRELKTAAELSSLRSPRRMKLVDFKIRTGNAAEGKKILAEMVKATPDYLPAWKKLADLQLAAKEYDECSISIDRIRAAEPADYEAGLLRARLRFAQGKAGEAIEEFERLRAKNPKSAELHYQLALAYLVNKDLGKATASLQQSVSLNTNLYEPLILLADLKLREGDAAAAIALLSDLVKKRPNDEQAHYLLANAYRARGTPDEALNVYRGLARSFPRNPRATLMIGVILRQQGKTAEARKAFENALELAPGLSAAVAQLVELDLADKNHTAALRRVQAAIEKNPKAADLRFIEAKALLARDDPAQAEASLRKSLELAPDFRDAYIELAQLFIRTKRPDLALAELDKALAKNPKDETSLMMTGILQEGKGDYAKATDTYEKLLAVNPKFSPALNNLAYIYAIRLKQVDKGFELAQKARELLPNDPAAADTLGWITYLRSDYAAALPLLQESADKLVSEPEVHYHLGMANYMMGLEEPALAALRLAVQSNKEFPGKDEARQKLAVLGGEAGRPVGEVIPSLEKSLAQSPNDVALLLRLGTLYEQGGQLEKAREVSEKALKINPKAVRAMLVLARVYGARADGGQRALDYARSARAAAPDDAEVAYAAGRVAFQTGQHDWAYSILQECNRKLAGNPEVLFDLAWAAYSMGRVAEAEGAMQNALRGGTNFSRAEPAKRFLDMVDMSKNQSKLGQGTPRIQEALKTNPDYVPALMAAALAWEQRGGYAEAKKLYEQVLSRYPKFTPATRNLAIVYAGSTDDVQKGYELAVRARQDLPDDLELARALGKLAYRRGEYQYAAQLLKELQQKKAADAEVYFYLGMSQARLKQKAESAASLRQALAMNLASNLGEEARRVLAELK